MSAFSNLFCLNRLISITDVLKAKIKLQSIVYRYIVSTMLVLELEIQFKLLFCQLNVASLVCYLQSHQYVF